MNKARPIPASLAGLALTFACGLLVLAVTWTAIVSRTEAYEQDAINSGKQNLANLSLAFDEGLSRSIKAIDQAMLSVRELYMRHGLTAEVKELTRLLAGSDTAVVGFGIFDAHGDVRFTFNKSADDPAGFVPGTRDIADRPHFKAHVESTSDQLYISPPAIERTTGRWSVFLSRRVLTADGGFSGTIVAIVDAAQLGDFYKKIDIGPDGVVTVIGTDGIARARVGAVSGTRFGDDLRHASIYREAMANGGGISRLVSDVDHQERLIAYRKIEGLPLIVTVASGTAEILKDARERRLDLFLVGGAITLTVCVLVSAVWVRWRRRRDYEAQSALLRAVFANMGEGLMILDSESRLVAWNDHLADLIGVDPTLLRTGTSLRDILLSQARAGEFGDCDPEAEADRRVREFGAPKNAVTTRTRPDGRQFELRRRGLPDGGLLTLYLDVTELKRVERALWAMNATLEDLVAERTLALTASERRLSRAQEVARVGHWVRTAGEVSYSRAAAGIFGVTPEALAVSDDDYVTRFVHPGDRSMVIAAHRLGAQGQARPLEYRITRPDGAVRHIVETIDAIAAEQGVAAETIGTVHDITERARAENDLATARANLADAVESVDHVIVLYDKDDKIILFNQRFLEQTREFQDTLRPGLRFEDVFGMFVERGLVPIPDGQDREAFIAARVADHQRADGRRLLRKARDGRTYEIWEKRSRGGGIVAVGLDVTERLLIEHQLRQAQRMEAVGNLTGGMAHDFNNLLAILLINLETLSPLTGGDETAASLVADSLTAVSSGAALTRRLLAFARRQTLAPDVVSVNNLIEGVVPLIGHALGETNALAMDLAGDIWPTFIDPNQLEASILNLATNARDAMVSGGRLTIATANRRIGPDDVPDLDAGDYVTITVADTGSGMTDEVRSRIFEPFFTTKETGHGTGLGLSMVFGFLRQSQGSVTVASEPGAGSTFCLYLPRREGRIADPPAPPSRPAAGGGGETVLLVEDNPLLRDTFARQLTGLGYDVMTAEDAAAGLAVLENHPIRLMITDVLMPGPMDGYGLARTATARWPDLRIILASGFADDRTREKDGGLPLSIRFLHKPVRRDALARVAREALDA